MNLKFKLPEKNYYPIILVWLIFNIAPALFIATLFIDLSAWKTSFNGIARIIVMYLLIYGTNYLIASFYFNLAKSPYKTEVKQVILHLFTIARTALVLIIAGAVAYFLNLTSKKFLLLIICLEVMVFIYQFLRKKILANRNKRA